MRNMAPVGNTRQGPLMREREQVVGSGVAMVEMVNIHAWRDECLWS